MNFNYSIEEEMLRDSVAQYVAAEARRPGRIDACADHWPKFAELGWLGIGISEQAGGYDGSLNDIMVINGVLGRALMREPYVGCAVLAPQVFLAAIGGENSGTFLRAAISGRRIWALANAEYEAAGEVRSIQTSATRDGALYTLRGIKTAVLGGYHATDFLVAARTAGATDDPHGITLFAIPRESAGLTVRNYEMVDCSAIADVILESVTVSADAVVGEPNMALGALETGTDIAIVASLFGVVGAMEKCVELTNEYLRERKQFGGPLWNSQVLRHRLADMLVSLEHARSAAYRGLAGLYEEDPRSRARAVSSAKIVVSRGSRFVCGQAIQLHGGIGLTDEMAVSHLFKYAAVTCALFGSESHHVARLGSLM
jgi:alkylation response protein AidB-like acyl-CoA dehydrogenase